MEKKGDVMMKKSSASMYLVVIILLTTFLYAIPSIEAATVYSVDAIPEEAIRLRILANSNSEADQAVKVQVRDAVVNYVNTWSDGINSKEDAEKLISENIPKIERIAKDVLKENGINETVKVEYTPTEFPTKIYGDIIYPAGTYDAVKISIGAAEGDNWWCVLYPPLCFLNAGTNEEVQKAEPQEVKSLTQELFSNLF